MKFGARDWQDTTIDERPVTTRACDCPGCAGVGLYPAPKARNRLRDYYWFCLDHIRAYNGAWDYCAGMSEAEIEDIVRGASVWERPTNPMGHWSSASAQQAEALRAKVWKTFFADAEREPKGRQAGERDTDSKALRAEMDALALLELEFPVTFATVKTRYRALVKRYHPDANGGSSVAEDKLKHINHAFTVLKAWFGQS